MAVGTKDVSDTTPAPNPKASAGKPEDNKPPARKTAPDTTVGSEATVDAANAAAMVADADQVAIVSRDKNGNPDQSANFEIITLGDDPSDELKAAAENHDGAAQGAENVKKNSTKKDA